jgi:hypothetical protein
MCESFLRLAGTLVTRRFGIAAALMASVAALALLVGGTAAGSSRAHIDPLVLRDTVDGQRASFVIHLEEQTDLSAAYAIREIRTPAAGTSTGLSGGKPPGLRVRSEPSSSRTVPHTSRSGSRT